MTLIAILVALGLGALAGFILGTRARVSTGEHCKVDVHWFFGWWVRCRDVEGCGAGKHCALELRRKGTEEQWADAGVIPGANLEWNEEMEYRCMCRPTPA